VPIGSVLAVIAVLPLTTFDARHSLNRFPFAGSLIQQENEIERGDWLERKATTFCIP